MKKYKKIIITIILTITLIIGGIVSLVIMDRNEQKRIIDKDEAEYGREYQKLSQVIPSYNMKPDRIIYKPKEKDYFYVIEPQEEEYEHLLEVIEDRMVYSHAESLLNDFKTESFDRIMSSGKNYIILDYNKERYENVALYDEMASRPIVYKLKDENRCKRLISYVTQFRKRYSLEELQKIINKKEFDV